MPRWRNNFTRAYNVAVGPARQILHVSVSHSGSHNDKTTAKYDHFLRSMRCGRYQQVVFDVRGKDGSKEQIVGLCCICDGGYHNWRILQLPVKMTSEQDLRRWSKRLESIRKDVARTFGALKMRFLIFIHGLPFKLRGFVENIFRTTCMLHNRLLAFNDYISLGMKDNDWKKADIARADAWIARNIATQKDACDSCPAIAASSSASVPLQTQPSQPLS
eukprot:6172995-Pleurochrysis_carterae.AAC.3